MTGHLGDPRIVRAAFPPPATSVCGTEEEQRRRDVTSVNDSLGTYVPPYAGRGCPPAAPWGYPIEGPTGHSSDGGNRAIRPCGGLVATENSTAGQLPPMVRQLGSMTQVSLDSSRPGEIMRSVMGIRTRLAALTVVLVGIGFGRLFRQGHLPRKPSMSMLFTTLHPRQSRYQPRSCSGWARPSATY